MHQWLLQLVQTSEHNKLTMNDIQETDTDSTTF